MKKLLSILAVSGIIGSSSKTVISCDDSSSVEKDLSKIDLGTDLGITAPATNEWAVNYFRQKIADFSNQGITAEDIKNDQKIGIALYDSTGTQVNVTDQGILDQKFNQDYSVRTAILKLSVEEGDKYFLPMENK